MPLITICLVILSVSCKKSTDITPETPESLKTATTADSNTPAVEASLLQYYFDYALYVRNIAGTKKAFNYSKEEIAKFRAEKFDKMIDNYLLYEKNLLIQKGTLKTESIQPFGAGDPPKKIFSGTASLTGAAGNMYVLTQMTTNSNASSITDANFSWGGVHGTMQSVGNLEQSYYQGVLTYKQYYSETVIGPGGVSRTSNLAVYGNIYGGSMTVNVMSISPP